jgi:hypothetical protein
MKRELKFWLFTVLLEWAIKFLPRDANKTWKWISQMPIEK